MEGICQSQGRKPTTRKPAEKKGGILTCISTESAKIQAPELFLTTRLKARATLDSRTELGSRSCIRSLRSRRPSSPLRALSASGGRRRGATGRSAWPDRPCPSPRTNTWGSSSCPRRPAHILYIRTDLSDPSFFFQHFYQNSASIMYSTKAKT